MTTDATNSLTRALRVALVLFSFVAACRQTDHSRSQDIASNSPDSANSEKNTPGSSSSAPSSGPPFDQAQLPTPTTGTYLVDYDNARVRCDYRSTADTAVYHALCALVAKQSDGTEIKGTKIKDGVDVAWQAPKPLAGSMTFGTCAASADLLSYQCVVTVGGILTAAEAQFAVALKDAHDTSRLESANLVLPYSVGVAVGYVPTMPYKYVGQSTVPSPASGASLLDTPAVALGFQTYPLSNAAAYFRTIALCTAGARMFYTAGNSVFEMIPTGVSLYGGSANIGNTDNVTNKLRVFLDPEWIACAPDGVYVSSPISGRLLRLHDDGSVEIIATTKNGLSSPDGVVAKGFDIQGIGPVALSSDGDLYFVDDSANKLAVYTATGHLRTIVANGSLPPWAGSGDITKFAPIHSPTSLAIGSDGSLYLADDVDAVVRRITPSGAISIAAGTGKQRYQDPTNPRALAQPVGLAFGVDGRLLVGEKYRGIKAINADGTTSQLISAGPDFNIAAEDLMNTPMSAKKITNVRPDFFAFVPLPDGSIIVDGEHGVIKYPRGSNSATALTGTVNEVDVPCGSLRPAAGAFLAEASTLTYTPDKRLAFIDWYSASTYNVLLYDLYADNSGTSMLRTIAGCSGETAFWVDDSTPAIGPFASATGGLVALNDGSFIWSNPIQNKIVKISRDGKVSTFAGSGAAASTGDGGLAINAAVWAPDGLAQARDGSIYFVERAAGTNSRVRKVGPDGIISTVVGSGPAGDQGEGQAAKFAQISADAVAVSGDGRLFIADYGNNKIKMVDTEGLIHTIAGGGALAVAPDGVDARLAAIGAPSRIAVTSDGRSVFFVDSLSGRVNQLLVNSQGGWTLSTLFGAQAQGDCGPGNHKGSTTSAGVDVAIKNSLAVVCEGTPQGVTVRDSCDLPGGDIRIAFSQMFTYYTNVVEIVRPCAHQGA